jgi:hypothetical protein
MENNCCENKEKMCCGGKETCVDGKGMCCHNWKKCHMMKKILVIIIIIIAFCLGMQFGQLKYEMRGYHSEKGCMMNWGYKNVKSENYQMKQYTPEVKPELKADIKPEVKQ